MKRKLFRNPYFGIKSLIDKSNDKIKHQGSDYVLTIAGSETYHTPAIYSDEKDELTIRQQNLNYYLVKKSNIQRTISTEMAKQLFDSIIHKLENNRKYKHINTRKDTWNSHWKFKDRVEGYNTSKVFSKGKRNMILYSAPPGKGFKAKTARVWVLFEPIKEKKVKKPSTSRFIEVFPHIWKNLEEKIGDDYKK
tara:strand:+ start:12084 stop:12662 length:579 start_codon:yes stop_codon:yes gene_type:complete